MKLFEAADIIIYIQGKGVVLKEKSLVAYNTVSGKIIAFGKDVLHMEENLPDNIRIISPMRRGMVADYISAAGLFTCLLNKALGRKLLRKLPVAVCVPKGITEVEKKALEDSLYQAGASEIFVTSVTLEQLLNNNLPGLILPNNWKKFKIFISITKDEPEYYIEEQLSELFSYASQEGVSFERVIEMLKETSGESML